MLIPVLLQVAGRDAWLSALLAVPLAGMFVYMLWHLRQNVDGEPRSILIQLVGVMSARFLSLAFAGYFFFVSLLSVVFLTDMVHIYFYPETPISVIVAAFIPFVAFTVRKGIWAIAMTATVFGILTVFTGNSTAFLSFPQKDWSEIQPFLEFGIHPVLWGSLIVLSMWVELLFLLFVPLDSRRNKGKSRIPLSWLFIVLTNGYMTASSLLGVVAFFGFDMARNFVYPTAEELNLLSLGFVDRFSIYIILNLSLGCFVRTSLYYRLTYELMFPFSSRQHVKPWVRNGLMTFALSVMGYAAWFIASDHVRVMQWTEYYTYTAALFIVPFILAGLHRFRTGLRVTNQPNG